MNDQLSAMAERESLRSFKQAGGGVSVTLGLVEREIKTNQQMLKRIEEEEEEIGKRLAAVSRPGYVSELTKEIAKKKEEIKNTAREIKSFSFDNQKSGKELYSIELQNKGIPDMVKKFSELENEAYLVEEKTIEIKKKNEEFLKLLTKAKQDLEKIEETEKETTEEANNCRLESHSPRSVKGRALIQKVRHYEDFINVLRRKNEKSLANEHKEIEVLRSLLEERRTKLQKAGDEVQEQMDEIEAKLKQADELLADSPEDSRFREQIRRLMNRQGESETLLSEAEQSKTNSFSIHNSSTNSFLRKSKRDENKPFSTKVKNAPISKSSDDGINGTLRSSNGGSTRTPGPPGKKPLAGEGRDNRYKPKFMKKGEDETKPQESRIEEESLEQTADFSKESLNLEKKGGASPPIVSQKEAFSRGQPETVRKEKEPVQKQEAGQRERGREREREKESEKEKDKQKDKEKDRDTAKAGEQKEGEAGQKKAQTGLKDTETPSKDNTSGSAALSKPKLFNFAKNKTNERTAEAGLTLPGDDKTKIEEKKSQGLSIEEFGIKNKEPHSNPQADQEIPQNGSKIGSTRFQRNAEESKSNSETGKFGQSSVLSQQHSEVKQPVEKSDSEAKSFNFNSRRRPQNDETGASGKNEESAISINNGMSRRNRNQLNSDSQISENSEKEKPQEKNEEFIPTISGGASRRNMKMFKKEPEDESGSKTESKIGGAGTEDTLLLLNENNLSASAQNSSIKRGLGQQEGIQDKQKPVETSISSNTRQETTKNEDSIPTISGVGSRRNQKVFRKEEPPEEEKPWLRTANENQNRLGGPANETRESDSKNDLGPGLAENSRRRSPFLSNSNNNQTDTGSYQKTSDTLAKKDEAPQRKRNIFEDKTEFNIPEIGKNEDKQETVEPRKRNIFGDNSANNDPFGKKNQIGKNNFDDDISFDKSIVDAGKLNFLQEEPKRPRKFNAEPDLLGDAGKNETLGAGPRASPFRMNAGASKQEGTKEREKQLAAKAEKGGNDVFAEFDFF